MTLPANTPVKTQRLVSPILLHTAHVIQISTASPPTAYCHGSVLGFWVSWFVEQHTPVADLTSAGMISARKSRYPGTCRISTSTESLLPGNGSARSSHNIWFVTRRRRRGSLQNPDGIDTLVSIFYLSLLSISANGGGASISNVR